jgi:hypothetical protein
MHVPRRAPIAALRQAQGVASIPDLGQLAWSCGLIHAFIMRLDSLVSRKHAKNILQADGI